MFAPKDVVNVEQGTAYPNVRLLAKCSMRKASANDSAMTFVNDAPFVPVHDGASYRQRLTHDHTT
jgi:hypothetical protein